MYDERSCFSYECLTGTFERFIERSLILFIAFSDNTIAFADLVCTRTGFIFANEKMSLRV